MMQFVEPGLLGSILCSTVSCSQVRLVLVQATLGMILSLAKIGKCGEFLASLKDGTWEKKKKKSFPAALLSHRLNLDFFQNLHTSGRSSDNVQMQAACPSALSLQLKTREDALHPGGGCLGSWHAVDPAAGAPFLSYPEGVGGGRLWEEACSEFSWWCWT
jgi:hypothetical protein